jgi:hypothetical protein
MKTQIEVISYSDNLFNGDWDDMDQYDIDASADAYADQLRQEIVRFYPDAEVTVEARYSAGEDQINVTPADAEDWKTYNEIIGWVSELGSQVYQAQDWVRMAQHG